MTSGCIYLYLKRSSNPFWHHSLTSFSSQRKYLPPPLRFCQEMCWINKALSPPILLPGLVFSGNDVAAYNMFSVSAEQRMSEEHLVWEQRPTELAKVTTCTRRRSLISTNQEGINPGIHNWRKDTIASDRTQ